MRAGSPGKPGDVVIVTGASTGLGLEIALHLAGSGFKVYATLRDLSKRADLQRAAAERAVSLDILHLDLTEPESIDAAVHQVLGNSGGIYALVNNAGIGLRGCVEDLGDTEIRRVFEANVFGTIAVTQRVLPTLRAAGRGRIITISSVGGRISSFGLAAYCGSKFALEGFGEALALEIAPFGLQAVLIEPGIIKTTRWTTNRGHAERALDPSRPYYALFQRSEALADERVAKSKIRPADVAVAVDHALTTPRPRMHYVVGRPAAAAVLLRRYLPEPLFERLYFGTLLRRITGKQPLPRIQIADG